MQVMLGSVSNGAGAMVQWHFVCLLAAPLAAGLQVLNLTVFGSNLMLSCGMAPFQAPTCCAAAPSHNASSLLPPCSRPAPFPK